MSAFSADGIHFKLFDSTEGLAVAHPAALTDHGFHGRVAQSCAYAQRLSPRELVSWFVSRLDFLSDGEIEHEHGEHSSDPGSFILNIAAVMPPAKIVALMELWCGPDTIRLRGQRDGESPDPVPALLAALAEDPELLSQCCVRIEIPDAGRRATWRCGWDGTQFILG